MTTWPEVKFDIDREYDLCFGCGSKNPIGLKLNFNWDGKQARAEFTPTEFYQGWAGIVHGGILNSMLDEAMVYAALFEGMQCITARMQSRLRRPALIDEVLIITSHLTKKARKVVEAKASISLKDGTPIAEGTSSQFVVKLKSS